MHCVVFSCSIHDLFLFISCTVPYMPHIFLVHFLHFTFWHAIAPATCHHCVSCEEEKAAHCTAHVLNWKFGNPSFLCFYEATVLVHFAVPVSD